MSNRETFIDKRERLSVGPRLRALDSIFADVEAAGLAQARRRLRSLTLIVLDAVLDGDEFALDTAVAGLQRIYGAKSVEWVDDPQAGIVLGRMEQIVEFALLGLERVPSLLTLADLESGGRAHEFLQTVEREPGASNDHVCDALGTSRDIVSRTGRYLLHRGLVRRQKVGRRNRWDLTPRGTQVLQMLDEGPQPRPRKEHRLRAS